VPTTPVPRALLAAFAQGPLVARQALAPFTTFGIGGPADWFLCDPHRIIVTGPTRLRGRTLDGRDLRSGMALIAAALAAEGESAVRPLETVERGYARVVEKLESLGARIARVA
jgi:UDP-N-acetylglucosamine 1-carboxyvinyltransferase